MEDFIKWVNHALNVQIRAIEEGDHDYDCYLLVLEFGLGLPQNPSRADN